MRKIAFGGLALGFLALALTLPVGKAQAAGKYGMAGCGLGSMLFGPSGEASGKIGDTKVKEVLAATTNGTFGSQTFGITTGTSNCTGNGVVLKDKEREAFAEVNLSDLSRDMAQGQGEYLTAFGGLLGCDAAGQALLGQQAQANYNHIFPSDDTTAQDVVMSVETLVRGDKALATSCTAI